MAKKSAWSPFGRGAQSASYTLRSGVWTLRRKIHLMMDTPSWTKGPNFINNKSIAVICWQGLLNILSTRKNLRLNSQLPVLCPACLHCLVKYHRKALVSSFYQCIEACPVQSELHSWIPKLHWTDLIGNLGRDFRYKKRPPLCLERTKVRLLPASLSPGP